MEANEELEVSYRRETKRNYLMIAAGQEQQGFEAQMLSENKVAGLLTFWMRREDDRCWFCYEITSKQPLSRLLERKWIGAEQMRRLLLGIGRTLSRIVGYLLSEDGILLDPQFVYVDPDSFQVGLCLLPGHRGNFPQDFSRLLQFLLGKADHQDQEAVVMIYGMYRESLKENYSIDGMMRKLSGEDRDDLPAPWEDGQWEDKQTADGETDITDGGETERDREHGGVFPVKERKEKYPRQPIRILKWLAVSAAAVMALWLWRGMWAIVRYGPILAGGCAAAAALAIWKSNMRGEKTESRSRSPKTEHTDPRKEESRHGDTYGTQPAGHFSMQEDHSWEAFFSDEEEQQNAAACEKKEAPKDVPQERETDSIQTALLWKRETQGGVRRLVGEAGNEEVIPISYYPFLIGKQENLADFILKRDTISRLHARIDRKENAYWLTDLNSTNGTSVNGRVLEANESVELEPGDQVALADLRFSFQ